MTINTKTYVVDGHHPRKSSSATLDRSDVLQVVYNVYDDDRFDNSAKPEEELINIVFLHGTQMCKEVWNYAIEQCFDAFGDKLGVVAAVDAANHGDSYRLNADKLGPVSLWEDGGKDIIKVVRHINVKGPVVLIGHSMGGAMALYAAHYEPSLIDSVIALDPVIYTDPEVYDSEVAAKFLGNRFQKLATFIKVEFKDWKEYETYITKVSIARRFHPRVLKDYMEGQAVVNSDGSVSVKSPVVQQLASYYSADSSLRDMFNLATTIRTPVLHLCGDIPDWNPAIAQEIMVNRFPDARAVLIPDGRHLVPFDMPDETFAGYKDFILERHEKGTAVAKEKSALRLRSRAQRDAYTAGRVKFIVTEMTSGRRAKL